MLTSSKQMLPYPLFNIAETTHVVYLSPLGRVWANVVRIDDSSDKMTLYCESNTVVVFPDGERHTFGPFALDHDEKRNNPNIKLWRVKNSV